MIELKKVYKTKNRMTEELFVELNERNLLTEEMFDTFFMLKDLTDMIPTINMMVDCGYIDKRHSKSIQDALLKLQAGALELLKGEIESLRDRGKIK